MSTTGELPPDLGLDLAGQGMATFEGWTSTEWAQLRNSVSRYLSARWNGIRSEHDDLTQAAILDLIHWLREHPDLHLDLAAATRVCIRIVERRACDNIRLSVLSGGVRQSREDVDAPASVSAADFVAREVLFLTLEFIATLHPLDRAIVLGEGEQEEAVRAVYKCDNIRKRRQRILGDLRAFIREKAGEEVDSFLSGGKG